MSDSDLDRTSVRRGPAYLAPNRLQRYLAVSMPAPLLFILVGVIGGCPLALVALAMGTTLELSLMLWAGQGALFVAFCVVLAIRSTGRRNATR